MDSLTVINSQPLISPNKIKDKALDQMTLPERTDLLREAYKHVEGDSEITTEEMEIIGRMETAVDQKIASWGMVIRKNQEAKELCDIEIDYYKKKLADANTRKERFEKKEESLGIYLKSKMIEFNKKKIETPLLIVALRKKPQSVEILEGADIQKPEKPEFTQTTVSTRWDKKAIKAKLSEGQLFKTVKLSEPGFSISIKGK